MTGALTQGIVWLNAAANVAGAISRTVERSAASSRARRYASSVAPSGSGAQSRQNATTAAHSTS